MPLPSLRYEQGEGYRNGSLRGYPKGARRSRFCSSKKIRFCPKHFFLPICNGIVSLPFGELVVLLTALKMLPVQDTQKVSLQKNCSGEIIFPWFEETVVDTLGAVGCGPVLSKELATRTTRGHLA